MTQDEAVDFLAEQILAARALGFPVVRVHTGVPTGVIERAAAITERVDVVLATEVQGPQSPESPEVAAVLEFHERLGSEAVGLLLDLSVSMRALPAPFTAVLTRLGASDEHVARVRELWATGAPPHAVLELDAPQAVLNEAVAGLVRFGRQDPRDWLPLVPQVVHVHAKFWELDETGDEPTVRNTEAFAVLREGGYDGFVSSEWGGSAWLDAGEVDAVELVRRHHELCSSLVPGPVVAAR